MGQCSSENSCQSDLCERSRGRRCCLIGAAPNKDEVAVSEEPALDDRCSRPEAQLPTELAVAFARAVEASKAHPRSTATLSVPKCKSKGVQTEPVTPATEVLPEPFCIPDGEPWELAPSTEGGSERISELDLGDAERPGSDAFCMPVESPGKGPKPPRLSEDLVMSGLLPDPNHLAPSISRSALLDAGLEKLASRPRNLDCLGSTLQRPDTHRVVPDAEDKPPTPPDEVVARVPTGALQEPLLESNPLCDEADSQRFLVEHEGVWLQGSDKVPAAALKDQNFWKKDVAHPTAVAALPGLRVQIPGHTAYISYGPPAELHWSDGSSWIREELQGRWRSSGGRRKYDLLIRDWKIHWDSKSSAAPTALTPGPVFPRSTVSMILDRAECSAVYEPGPPAAKLEWSDGEVWTRLSFEEDTARPWRPAAHMLP